MITLKKIFRKGLTKINLVTPKLDSILVIGSSSIEVNAVELCRYIGKSYNYRIRFAVSKKYKSYLKDILPENVSVICLGSIHFFLVLISSRIIFSTHNYILEHFSKRQLFINVWHGVGHKKIRRLKNAEADGIPANITIATSRMTQEMFAKAFNVSLKDVAITGYPRNDIFFRKDETKNVLYKNNLIQLPQHENIITWLPTYRSDVRGDLITDGIEYNNPFQIKDFDEKAFNDFLVDHQTICYVKPHPFSLQNYNDNGQNHYTNLKFITEEWLLERKLTLYHLLAVSDVLISDFSSAMIDFLFVDKPIICFSTDFDIYKDSRGFYFEPIEDYIPSKITTTSLEFYQLLSDILSGKDEFVQKRNKIRTLYFSHIDCHNSKRIAEAVLDDRKKRECSNY